MIRVVLVDDEAPARARLRALLSEIHGVEVVGEAAGAADARTEIAALAPDVVFLDIEMPAERGTDLAASLPEPRPFIVFATAYDSFAVDAFQYDAADYLLKPITRPRLSAAIDRMRDKLARRRAATREITDASAAQFYLQRREFPVVPGYAMGARTLAARGVGGDFYDAEPLGDGRVAFVLGDVSGKGMAAGLIASSVQARWQAAVRQHDETLTSMMATLNRDVFASTDGSRYATLVHGVLDGADGRITFVNAGHPSSMLVTADGTWRSALVATAPAVGLFDGATFDASVCTLAIDDTLVIMSDGVSEARDSEGRDLALDRVADAVTGHRGRDVSELAAAIVDLVRDHRGRDQGQDDVTVFAMRRTG